MKFARRLPTLLLATSTVLGVVVTPGSAKSQQKGGLDETGPYDVIENWLETVEAGWYHHVTGVFAQSPDRIFVTASGATPIAPPPAAGGRPLPPPQGFDPERPGAKSDHFLIVVDGDGKKIDEWRHALDLLVRPHAVQISPYDPDGHVWIIDRDGHQIVKFSNDGQQVVMTLGEKGVPGTDEQHFNRPADMVFLPDGSFLVADGYANTRIVKFDQNGDFVTTWGTAGDGPGQFNLVHCVVVDAEGRVYVADRSNRRIQVFDANGRYLEEWASRRPNHMLITQDQFLWLADGAANRFAKYDLEGTLLTYWGTQGSFPGAISNPHAFSVDSDGNLYVVDYLNNRLQKFTPKREAEPSRLMVQPPR